MWPELSPAVAATRNAQPAFRTGIICQRETKDSLLPVLPASVRWHEVLIGGSETRHDIIQPAHFGF